MYFFLNPQKQWVVWSLSLQAGGVSQVTQWEPPRLTKLQPKQIFKIQEMAAIELGRGKLDSVDLQRHRVNRKSYV